MLDDRGHRLLAIGLRDAESLTGIKSCLFVRLLASVAPLERSGARSRMIADRHDRQADTILRMVAVRILVWRACRHHSRAVSCLPNLGGLAMKRRYRIG